MEVIMGSEETSRQGEIEYEIGRKTVAGAEGFEPSALGFGDRCSDQTELRPYAPTEVYPTPPKRPPSARPLASKRGRRRPAHPDRRRRPRRHRAALCRVETLSRGQMADRLPWRPRRLRRVRRGMHALCA